LKIDRNGLKVKNWSYLCLLTLIILVVLGILQFSLLSRFYNRMKINELTRVGEDLVRHFGKENYNDLLEDYSARYKFTYLLFSERDLFNPPLSPFLGGGPFLTATESQTIRNMFSETQKDAICYISRGEPGLLSLIVYVARIEVEVASPFSTVQTESIYLYLRSYVPPIDSAISALRSQFLLMAVILLALSMIAAQLISKKMSQPILRLTKTAEKLARGDLDVEFDRNSGYTELEKLSETLNYATRELSKTDAYRKEFIANLSHDLKTPLTIIKFYGELIHDISGANPEKRDAHSEMIIKEADRLTDMVNEVLELSKLESLTESGSRMELQPVDLSACVHSALDSFGAFREREGYVFHTQIAENLTVCGSAPVLARALYNLLSNAVNYTGEDKQITVTLSSPDGKNARFAVTDTGTGIPADKLDSIWERYYKGGETHKRALVGTGLGLSIVKQSLELHNARFGVDSKQGEGSTFWFELPLV